MRHLKKGNKVKFRDTGFGLSWSKNAPDRFTLDILMNHFWGKILYANNKCVYVKTHPSIKHGFPLYEVDEIYVYYENIIDFEN